MKKRKIIIASLLLMCTCNLSAQVIPYQDTSLSSDIRAKDLCSRLTLEEKISLMQNGSPAIPRLGIPQFEWWSEALHGLARNGYATVFPATIGMAASFDDALLYRIYDAISDEARAKNTIARNSGEIKRYQGLSIWTPNINIFRDPRWGRGQETYGEDPYLTTRMGLAVVRGLQGPKDHKYRKLLACAKHFAVHSGPEWNRHQFNIENLPERDLWETYLPAFKALVQEGHVAEIMCAYQRIDGEPCCGNNRYLKQILRNEWGYKGLVTSDCGAISDFWVPGRHGVSKNAAEASSKAVLSGTDVECGNNYKSLADAVNKGLISESQIDSSLTRLLKARFELGDFDSDELVEWKRIPSNVVACASHKQMALDMARETMTLLMNKDNMLPLKKNGTRIAVMGPNANDSTMMWGNYNGYPTRTTTILQGIKQKTPNVRYINVCGLTRNEVCESRFSEIYTADGKNGITATYWNNIDMKGEPANTQTIKEPINLCNAGNTVFATGVNLNNFSAQYRGIFCPSKSEKVTLSMRYDDAALLIVNGDTLINGSKPKSRVVSSNKEICVEAGKKYNIQIDYRQSEDMAVMAFDIIHESEPTNEEILSQTKDVDVIIFVGGISSQLEGEEMKIDEKGFKGGDRTDIELPQSQRDIIARLHDAGKKIVFVNCSGSAIGLVQESVNTDAILQAWYPGEAGGTAVADVLFGDYNPSGKLPITFYKNVNQLPDFLDYRMTNRTYRYFKGEPLFSFGYGLSYTSFSFKKPKYANKEGKLYVEVTNSGKISGGETVQVYIKNKNDVNGPNKSLKAFIRIFLQAKEKQMVTIDLPKSSFECWDANTNTMRIIPGVYEIMVGSSSNDTDLIKIETKIS